MRFTVSQAGPQPVLVESLLRGLPEWFGVESAIAEYISAADLMPTFVASESGGTQVGVLLLDQHFPESAEIHLLAIERTWHRRGVGSAMVNAAASALCAAGVAVLSVKTLGPSHPDSAYAGTREFYRSCGFISVEEFASVWPGNPCLLLVKPLLDLPVHND